MKVIWVFLLLGGCVAVREPIVYTQDQIDAINARVECKRIARTLIQISRCDVR